MASPETEPEYHYVTKIDITEEGTGRFAVFLLFACFQYIRLYVDTQDQANSLRDALLATHVEVRTGDDPEDIYITVVSPRQD